MGLYRPRRPPKGRGSHWSWPQTSLETRPCQSHWLPGTATHVGHGTVPCSIPHLQWETRPGVGVGMPAGHWDQLSDGGGQIQLRPQVQGSHWQGAHVMDSKLVPWSLTHSLTSRKFW